MTFPCRTELKAREKPPPVIELVAVGLVIVMLAWIKIVAHNRFGTGFDTALFGNVAWRLGNGFNSVSTLTGFQYFATHVSGVILVLAPVFAESPTTGMLLTFIWQTLSIGLIGVAIWQVASVFSLSSQSRRILLLLAVFSPGALLATRLDVHEPTLGLGFLAMTLSSGLAQRSIRKCWWWPVLAAACRIEMAVATIVAGVLLYRRGSKQVGRAALSAGSLGVAFSMWFVLRSGSEAASVAAHFSHLGSTISEVAATAVGHPTVLFRPLGEPVMLLSLFLWLLPSGIIVPLLGWRYLLVALPLAGVAIFGVWPPADLFVHHYWYGFLVAAPMGVAEALRRRPQLEKVFAFTSVTGITLGWVGLLTLIPILEPVSRTETATLREMVDYVSTNHPGGLSAPVNVLPHLVGRVEIYHFPRPFLCDEARVGPFGWSGAPPDLVVVPKLDLEEIESDANLASSLSKFYVMDETADLISPFLLKSGSVSGLRCR